MTLESDIEEIQRAAQLAQSVKMGCELVERSERISDEADIVVSGDEFASDSGDDNDEFDKFYLCFEAMKLGFISGCCPAIGVDGCFLKGPYEL